MKTIKHFIKHNTGLAISTFISLGYIAFYIVFQDAPEIMPYGDVLYEVFFQLSMGIFVSWIFYIIVVYIPELNRRNMLRKSINKFYEEIFQRSDQLIEQINLRISKTDEINTEGITIFCSVTTVEMSTSVHLGTPFNPPMTWKDFFLFIIDMNTGTINKIFNSFAHLIDTEELVLLNELLKCELFSRRTFIDNFHTFQQENIVLFCSSLTNYFEIIDKLKRYHREQMNAV